MKRALFIMAKQPRAGWTKTRLCPPLTPALASALYAAFLSDVITTCRLAHSHIVGLTQGIAYAPSQEAASYFRSVAPDFLQTEQQGSDLAQRLDGVLRHALAAGYDQVVAINSDSPTLPVSLLVQAYQSLDQATNDLVLGPCDDGGYYLIGVKGEFGGTVRNVAMSTPQVLQQTVAEADAAGLQTLLLPSWYDVDDGASLERLREELAILPTEAAPATRLVLAKLAAGVG